MTELIKVIGRLINISYNVSSLHSSPVYCHYIWNKQGTWLCINCFDIIMFNFLYTNSCKEDKVNFNSLLTESLQRKEKTDVTWDVIIKKKTRKIRKILESGRPLRQLLGQKSNNIGCSTFLQRNIWNYLRWCYGKRNFRSSCRLMQHRSLSEVAYTGFDRWKSQNIPLGNIWAPHPLAGDGS